MRDFTTEAAIAHMKATTEVQKSKVSDVGILGGAQVSKADILLGAVLSMP